MCTGACLLYKIKRVVIGENVNFMGNEKLLKERGVEVVVVDSQECKDAMARFIREQPALWWVFILSVSLFFFFFFLVFADVFWGRNEDIGEQ